MKIITRVKVAGALVIFVLLVYGAVILHFDRTMEHLSQEARKITEIVNRIVILRSLTQDYLLYRTERAQRQWSAVFDDIRQLLDQPEYLELQRKYDLEDTASKLKIVGGTFSRLLTIREVPGPDNPAGELQNRLATQLLLTTQDLVTRFFNLNEEINKQLLTTQRLSTILDTLAIAVFGIFLISTAVFLLRSVVKPVLKLHEGAQIIGAGNLDHKVGINTGDEIGELSQTFDEMTANLKKVTVSRDELVKEMEERRRAEEKAKRLASFPQLNPSPVLEIDAGGAITFYNQAAVEVLEKIGPEAKLADLLPVDLGEIAAAARQYKEKLFYREVRVKDTVFGQNIYFVAPYDVLRIYCLDITARKQVEEELRESEDRLRMAQQAAQIGSFKWNVQTGENIWSPELEAMYGLPPGGFARTQKAWEDLLHPDDRPETLRRVDLSMESGAPTEGEWRVVWPDGSFRWLAGRWQVLNDEFGKPLIMTGINIDITARKQAEARLKADFLAMTRLHEISTHLIQEDSLSSLMEKVLGAAVGITAADMGTIQLLDPISGALKIIAQIGFEPPFLKFFDTVDDGLGVCGESKRVGGRVVVEDVTQSPVFVGRPALEVVLAAGVRAVQSTPIVSRTGALLGMIATHWRRPYRPEEHVLRTVDLLARQAADLLERTRAEEALKERTTQLERSNRDLEDFAYVSSHDLKEPLRQIGIFSEILAKEYGKHLNERGVRYSGYITAGAKRLLDLINDLLSYSLVGQAEIPPVPASLEDIFEKTLKNLHTLIMESGAQISHDPLPALRVNPNQMAQLLQNLIANALKFRDEQPTRIHLSAREEGGEWVISIRDNGIGFDQTYAEHIFQVFKRMHSQEKYPGTGIGLAICKKIVERHGGRIWAESQPGQGATFYFTIPA